MASLRKLMRLKQMFQEVHCKLEYFELDAKLFAESRNTVEFRNSVLLLSFNE